MLKKVWKQIRLFLFPRPGDFYRAAKSIDLNHELAISRSSLGETELSPRVQKIYQSYIQGLERAVGKASRPLGFRFVARLAHYLTWIILPLQVAKIFTSKSGNTFLISALPTPTRHSLAGFRILRQSKTLPCSAGLKESTSKSPAGSRCRKGSLKFGSTRPNRSRLSKLIGSFAVAKY